MTIKPLITIALLSVFLTGCHMLGDHQIKPSTHYKVIAEKITPKKVHSNPKPGVWHKHPANHYTKIVKHSHANGQNHHKHHYGKAPAKKSGGDLYHVKVVSAHRHYPH